MGLTIYLPAASASRGGGVTIMWVVILLAIIGLVIWIYFPTVFQNKKEQERLRELEVREMERQAFQEQEEQRKQQEHRERERQEQKQKEQEKKEQQEQERQKLEQKEREQREQIIVREAVWRDDYGELFRSRQRPLP